MTTCAHCGEPIPPTAPSPDFCNERHQRVWLATHSRPLESYYDRIAREVRGVR